MRSAFESINGMRRDGDRGRGRGRGPIVLVAALSVFVAALLFFTTSAYGAPEAKPPAKAAKKKPKVEAGIRRGQLNVVGTAKSERIPTIVDLGGDE